LWDTNVITDPVRASARFEAGRAWQRKLFDGGFSGIDWHAEYGGQRAEGR